MPAWGLDMGKTKEELIQYLGDMMVSMANAIANGFRMSRKDVNAAKKDCIENHKGKGNGKCSLN